MKKLSIVYHYFAHYREPVLRELCQRFSAAYQIELMSDEKAEVPALKTIQLQDFCQGLCDYRNLKNIWLGPWLWQIGLLWGIIKGKSDVIIFLGQFNFLSTWLGVVLARLMRKKTYFWSHGVYGNEGRLKRLIRVRFYKLAHGMLLYGNYSRDLLIDYGMCADRLHVIYNSLDYRLQKFLRDQKHASRVSEIRFKLFKSEDPYIIFVGRLTAVKRLDLLLSAVFQLNRSSECNVRCLIVGDGPERNTLELQVKRNGLGSSVHFFGACHDEETLSDLIYAADLCVAPGNVGLTAMHSLVYGTPVITHNEKSSQMPEFEAIVSGVSGGFFTKDDVEDLRLKISEWLKVTSDARDAVRIACFKVIDEKYNPAYQAKVIARVIDEEGCLLV